MKKTIVMLLIGILAISMIPTVFAGPLGDKDKAWRAEYNTAKDKFVDARNFYTDSRQDWISARNKLKAHQDKQSEGYGEDHASAKVAAKDYLLKALDVMEEKLNTVKSFAENQIVNEDTRDDMIQAVNSQLDDIQPLRDRLEAIDPEAEGAVADLRDAANDVRDRWNDVKPTVKKWVGHALADRVLHVLNRFESLSDFYHTKLANVDPEDASYDALVAQLEDFDDHVDLAWDAYDDAKDASDSITSVSDADSLAKSSNDFIKKANGYLREAYASSKELVKEYKASQKVSPTDDFDEYEDGTVYKAGNGRVEAWGEGFGSAELNGHATMVRGRSPTGDGSITVVDNGGDAFIVGPGQDLDQEDNVYTYSGSGSVRVSGSDVHVTIEGTDVHFVAEGDGDVTLTGKGRYEFGGKEGRWGDSNTIEVVGTGVAIA